MKMVLGMTPRNTGRCLAAAPALPSNAEPPQPTRSVSHGGRSSRVAHTSGVAPAEVVAS